jgi:hypothetical protein
MLEKATSRNYYKRNERLLILACARRLGGIVISMAVELEAVANAARGLAKVKKLENKCNQHEGGK